MLQPMMQRGNDCPSVLSQGNSKSRWRLLDFCWPSINFPVKGDHLDRSVRFLNGKGLRANGWVNLGISFVCVSVCVFQFDATRTWAKPALTWTDQTWCWCTGALKLAADPQASVKRILLKPPITLARAFVCLFVYSLRRKPTPFAQALSKRCCKMCSKADSLRWKS